MREPRERLSKGSREPKAMGEVMTETMDLTAARVSTLTGKVDEQRWLLKALAGLLAEKGLVTPSELDRSVKDLRGREDGAVAFLNKMMGVDPGMRS
jgi:hypothetical protein